MWIKAKDQTPTEERRYHVFGPGVGQLILWWLYGQWHGSSGTYADYVITHYRPEPLPDNPEVE